MEKVGNITVLTGNVQIPDDICTENNLEKKVLVIWETCPACAEALPALQELELEMNLTFEYIDLGTQDGRFRIVELGIVPRYIPAVIADCRTYIGAYSKEEYQEILEGCCQ